MICDYISSDLCKDLNFLLNQKVKIVGVNFNPC
jgi:hypothetical protein